MSFNNQIGYWNSVASVKKFTTQLDLSLLTPYLNSQALIVDYGCGYGRILNELYNKGFKNLIGFYYSSEMIERGIKERPFLDLRLSKKNKMDNELQKVDMILIFAVLTCIIDNDEQKWLINEIEHVLKPESFIYINDFLISEDKRNRNRYNLYKDKYKNYGCFELVEGAVLRHHSIEWINELICNFEAVVQESINFQTMNGNVAKGIKYLGRLK